MRVWNEKEEESGVPRRCNLHHHYRAPMNRRHFIQSAASSLAAGILRTDESMAATNQQTRPNFLFMIADDLTYRGIRSLGNEEVHTPNLDRLVENGCAFTHC